MGVCLQPLTDGPRVQIDKPILFVGRDPDCDIVLTNSRRISRKHCCLAHVNNQLTIRDLGSMNGVWVNGARVEQTGLINVGDEISFGDVRYRLIEEDKDAPVVEAVEVSSVVPVIVEDAPAESAPIIAMPVEDEDLPLVAPLDDFDDVERVPLSDSDLFENDDVPPSSPASSL